MGWPGKAVDTRWVGFAKWWICIVLAHNVGLLTTMLHLRSQIENNEYFNLPDKLAKSQSILHSYVYKSLCQK